VTEYLPILAMGGFGVVLAIVSHFSLSRERKALLDARARLAEEAAKAAGPKGASGRDLPLSALVRTGGRTTQAAPKQYRRVRGK
jgi:hypothetical protein